MSAWWEPRVATKEGSIMPGIVEFPKIVQRAQAYFGDLFYGEPQRRHFAEYLTGLMVAQRKTVLGISDEFPEGADQSCLNRFLTAVHWDEYALNQRRLELLQKDPSTRYSEQGVIAIDNVLIDHEGLLIDDVGWFWDHAEERYKIAHDYVFANYVATSGKHYPLDFARFRKRELCATEGTEFLNHTQLCCGLIEWTCDQEIPGDFTFDSYFTSAEVLNCVHRQQVGDGRQRGYVGDLKSNRKVIWKGRELRVDALAASIPSADRKKLHRGDQWQWYFTVSLDIPGVKHRVRIVVLWNSEQATEPCKILVTNRTKWEVTRIVRVYGKRWTGTETFHRDGKQQLGMGDCQLRHGVGQTRHMYLVMLAYSLLILELRQVSAQEWTLNRLTTIGEACRAILRETLGSTLAWAFNQVQKYKQEPEQVIARLGLGFV
jgi:hypothetical protein